MAKPSYQSALIVGAGADSAPRWRGSSPRGHARRARRAQCREARAACAPRPGPRRSPATRPTRPRWRACSTRSRRDRRARCRRLQRQRPGARPGRRAGPGRGRARAHGQRLSAASWWRSRPSRRMLPKGHGAILFTGASASVKGYPQSAPFAMGKFALRGLAQSMARELSPQGIHVAHFVIDGGIRNPGRVDPAGQARQHARPRRDRRNLSACAAPAAQRLDLGGRVAALGGAVLTRFERPSAPPAGILARRVRGC